MKIVLFDSVDQPPVPKVQLHSIPSIMSEEIKVSNNIR